MNPPIKDFIEHPFCSDRIEEFCRELEQAEAYQEFPISKKYTSEENQILLDLIKNGYITCNLEIPLTIRKRKFYPNTLQSIYSCMQNGTDISNDPDFYNSLFIEHNKNHTLLARLFVDALYTQDILWIKNNLAPLYNYIDSAYYSLSAYYGHKTFDDYLSDSIIILTIYCYLHPETCTDPTFKRPTKSQQKLLLSNILYSDNCFTDCLCNIRLNNSIIILKFLFGISDKYISDIFSPVTSIHRLFENCFSKFNITSLPSFIPNFMILIEIAYFSGKYGFDYDFKIDYLISPWWTAELISHFSQYQSVFDNIPSNLKTIQYLLQNNASEKALELLKMEFLNIDEYPLLFNDICSESFNIPAKDKSQIKNFLLKYIPDSSH